MKPLERQANNSNRANCPCCYYHKTNLDVPETKGGVRKKVQREIEKEIKDYQNDR